MAKAESNRVRDYRMAAGLSQVALAAEAQLTRQSIHAIESSRATPAVDVALRIAAVLNSSVEVLFGLRGTEAHLTTEPFAQSACARVALANIGSRWVSYPLDAEGGECAADGLVLDTKRKQHEVSLLRSVAECRENVMLMGCAPALGILAARLNTKVGPGHFLWLSRSSSISLQARFDLVLSHDSLSDPRMTRLFETLSSASFRRELEAIGYDTSCSGDRVADIAA